MNRTKITLRHKLSEEQFAVTVSNITFFEIEQYLVLHQLHILVVICRGSLLDQWQPHTFKGFFWPVTHGLCAHTGCTIVTAWSTRNVPYLCTICWVIEIYAAGQWTKHVDQQRYHRLCAFPRSPLGEYGVRLLAWRACIATIVKKWGHFLEPFDKHYRWREHTTVVLPVSLCDSYGK